MILTQEQKILDVRMTQIVGNKLYFSMWNRKPMHKRTEAPFDKGIFIFTNDTYKQVVSEDVHSFSVSGNKLYYLLTEYGQIKVLNLDNNISEIISNDCDHLLTYHGNEITMLAIQKPETHYLIIKDGEIIRTTKINGTHSNNFTIHNGISILHPDPIHIEITNEKNVIYGFDVYDKYIWKLNLNKHFLNPEDRFDHSQVYIMSDRYICVSNHGQIFSINMLDGTLNWDLKLSLDRNKMIWKEGDLMYIFHNYIIIELDLVEGKIKRKKSLENDLKKIDYTLSMPIWVYDNYLFLRSVDSDKDSIIIVDIEGLSVIDKAATSYQITTSNTWHAFSFVNRTMILRSSISDLHFCKLKNYI